MIYDYIDGVNDLKMNRIRFNGDIRARLQENPIRILRYFRSENDLFTNNSFLSMICRFFGRLSSDAHTHADDVLEAIRKCGMALQGTSQSIFSFSKNISNINNRCSR